MGVASYTNVQLKEIQDQLPSVEEIKARQQQYEYYRDKLLTFKRVV